MVDRKSEWYRDWAKEKPPSPWLDRVLGAMSIAFLVATILSFIRSV
jgi:hypothetical protein